MSVPVQKEERGVKLRGTGVAKPHGLEAIAGEGRAGSVMLAKEIVLVALGALRANKMRSFLTMLGIVIGVAAVIAMVAIGKGAQKSISDRIAGLGTTLLTVRPGARRGFGVQTENNEKLTVEDADALLKRGKYFAAVGPEMNKRTLLQSGNLNAQTQVTGALPNWLDIRKFTLASGRFFTDAEEAGMRRVAIVGSAVVDNLGLQTPEALIGEYVRLGGLQFEVIGVLASKGQTGGFGNNPDDIVVVPLSTARYRLMGTDEVNSINVLAASESQIPQAQADIQSILRREHRLVAGKKDDFDIRNQAEFLNTFAETTKTFTFLLAGIAAVSLLVGGIGIMNIMLASITERIREIGIRKAIGATFANVFIQILVESVVIAALGGMLGLAASHGIVRLLTLLSPTENTPIITLQAMFLAFGLSAIVGVLAGLIPAFKAARLDPIQALRYE